MTIFKVLHFSCLLLLTVFLSSAVAQDDQGSPDIKKRKTNEQKVDELDGWLVRLLNNRNGRSSYLEYLFADAELTSDQLAEISRIMSNTNSQLSAKRESIGRLRNELASATTKIESEKLKKQIESVSESFASILKEYCQCFRDCLLEHQMEKLTSKLKMRSILAATARPSIEFPLVSRVQMSNSDKKLLQKSITSEKQRIALIEVKLRQEAWKSIMKELPDSTKLKIEKIIAKELKND